MNPFKAILLLLLLLLISIGNLSGKSILINTNILNVRDQPQGKKIGKVFKGGQFVLLDKKGSWGKIKFKYKKRGWLSLKYTKDVTIRSTTIPLQPFCKKLNREFDKLNWSNLRCNSSEWQANMRSVLGNPLIYAVIGDTSPTSLLICSVHSDENVAYQCFRSLQHLQQLPNILNHRVVIAPLVNPDGFLSKIKTRTNANKIDLNRNLPTRLWLYSATKSWKKRYKSDKRRYPGKSANSEPESQFLINLIKRFNPDKVISIHAPMNFLDLDYDESRNSPIYQKNVLKKAQNLALRFSKESRYRFRNYRTFIGSLGRYGREWRVPIYTLELPSSDNKKSEHYFTGLKDSLFNSFNVILNSQKTAKIEYNTSQLKVN